MTLLDEVLNGWGGAALLGAGAIIAAPLLVPVLGAVIRPVAKALVQGGLWIVDSVQELAMEDGDSRGDLIEEARAEYHTGVAATTK
jgi:hypothetical protein